MRCAPHTAPDWRGFPGVHPITTDESPKITSKTLDTVPLPPRVFKDMMIVFFFKYPGGGGREGSARSTDRLCPGFPGETPITTDHFQKNTRKTLDTVRRCSRTRALLPPAADSPPIRRGVRRNAPRTFGFWCHFMIKNKFDFF